MILGGVEVKNNEDFDLIVGSQYCNVRNIVAQIGQNHPKPRGFLQNQSETWPSYKIKNLTTTNMSTKSVDQHQDASHSKIRDHIHHALNSKNSLYGAQRLLIWLRKVLQGLMIYEKHWETITNSHQYHETRIPALPPFLSVSPLCWLKWNFLVKPSRMQRFHRSLLSNHWW